MARLTGKVAIVTGGARGIGAASVKKFVEHGGKVMIADILIEEGQALATGLGDQVDSVKLDVTDADDWKNTVAQTLKRFGRLDILVNNAGFGGVYFKAIEDIDIDISRRIMDINFHGTLMGIQAVTPSMVAQGNGSIVNISSSNGMLSANGLASYCASKWAVRGLTKSAALELGPRHIRVNSIHPGGADTEMGNVAKLSRDQYSKGMQHWPLGRACDPEEIAEGILYFASDESGFCTGAELAIDGGQTAGVYYQGLPGGSTAEIR